MGNSPGQGTLTHHWQHVSPSLIRHSLTNQLIQQHTLTTPSPDRHALHQQLLTKRIRLQHPNILKLIYFAPDQSSQHLCSFPTNRQHQSTLVYTQYPGDSLNQYGKINPMPLKAGCPCVGLLQGVSYLQQYYGSFQVSPTSVFLSLEGNGKQAHVKVWIHSQKAECQPQFACSQPKMQQTVVNVLTYIQQQQYCSSMSESQLHMFRQASSLQQLKRQVISFHRRDTINCDEMKHKKCMSSYQFSNREQSERNIEVSKLQIESQQRPALLNHPSKIQFRYHQSTPHSSTHQINTKITKVPEQPTHPQQRRMLQIQYNPTDPKQISTEHSLLTKKQNVNPPQHKNITFNYRSADGPIRKIYQEHKNIPFQYSQTNADAVIENRAQRSYTNPQPNAINYRPNVLFDHDYGTHTSTVHNSPYDLHLGKEYKIAPVPSAIESQSNPINQEMELPIKQQRQSSSKDHKSHLPTTSRSPRRQKQNINTKPITEVDQPRSVYLNESSRQSRGARIKSHTGSSSQTNKKVPSFKKGSISKAEKYNKIQQYTKQIRQYEQNIRNWMSKSMGTRKRKAINVKPPLKSDRQFKQVKSQYNDDDSKMSKDDLRLKSQEEEQAHYGFPKFRKNTQVSRGSDLEEVERRQSLLVAKLLRTQNQNHSQIRSKQSKQIQKEYKNLMFDDEHQRNFQLERQRQLNQLQNDRTRKVDPDHQRQHQHKLQKQEMQRDLLHQTQLINEQIQDILNQQAMKEQYRSIREKVKKKQKIFAQLKAEAIKILNDSQY